MHFVEEHCFGCVSDLWDFSNKYGYSIAQNIHY